MPIKIENGKVRLMIKRGTVISPNSRFTIPLWNENRKRIEIDKRAIIYNGKGCFDYSQSSTNTISHGSFTVYYWKTSNPDYDIVELPIIFKEKGYITVHKGTGGILSISEAGKLILIQKLYINESILIPWLYERSEIPVPEPIKGRHRERQINKPVKKELTTRSEITKNGRVILKQLKFPESDYSQKENEFKTYLETVRCLKRTDVAFTRSIIHFALVKNSGDELIYYIDSDSFLTRELKGYSELKHDARRRYKRCFKLWGEFLVGKQNKDVENKEILTKYSSFVKNQMDKHYSLESILKTCQVVDRIKNHNEYCDKDILNMDSDKLCEKVTGRQYKQNIDKFLNNIIRKYQTYLQECEA